MSAHQIVPASILHVKPLSRSMRTANQDAVLGRGYDPRRALRQTMQQSHYCRTAMLAGKPVAMWGASGSLLSDTAHVWLVIADELRHMPLAIMREARRELAEVASRHDELSATVLPDDATSVRFAIRLGFRGGAVEGGSAKVMADVLDNPAYRVPIGGGYAIRLLWMPGA